ncbi:MAG TPA: hypothetical protein VKP61_15100 [Candidatus Acidoferrum sp.]|nr:hypothetical protein [Candidatus Acidoferrum sp.]
MSREKITSMLLIGIGILGLLYLLGKKTTAAPGQTAGGAPIATSPRSISGGVSGSIPNIIAAAAALTGTSQGSVAQNLVKNAGGAPSPGMIQPSAVDYSSAQLISPADSTIFQGYAGNQLVSTDNPTDVALPNVSSPFGALDIPAGVTALDAGGLDSGSLYSV